MRDFLHQQHILILGLGESGLAMARWCLRCGADVTVADTREHPARLDVLTRELPQVRFVHAAMDAALLAHARWDAVYRSPGLTPRQLAQLMDAAHAQGVAVGGELDLFTAALGHLRAEQGYTAQVVAVTGTNGKTTVTDLTSRLIHATGKQAVAAGNISPSMLDALGQALDAGKLPEVWVLELSSFQLDAVQAFDPTAATILNITQDHLDWHGGMEAYAAAKARIFGPHTRQVLNREDARVMAFASAHAAPVVTFGSDLPTHAQDWGLDTQGGMAWLVHGAGSGVERLLPEGALRIHGRHNALNALAALALASACGCDLPPMLAELRNYRGGPHRVESLGIVHGVEFFDDSKGTNVGATAAALAGLGAHRRVVIILGGDGKGQDFSPLAAPVAEHARAVVLIGRDGPRIGAVLKDRGVPLIAATTMEDAVQRAAAAAQAGDAVLLSPACASFDMFRSYLHRAEVFRDDVREYALEHGVELEFAA